MKKFHLFSSMKKGCVNDKEIKGLNVFFISSHMINYLK